MKEKPILVQGSMEIELEYIKEKLEEIEKIEINGYIFYKGKINNYPIVLSKTGVGVVNSTAASVIAIINFEPCIIINQGVAGGIGKNIHKESLVIGEKCINNNSFKTPYKEEGQGSNSLEWELNTFIEGIDELVEIKANKELVELAKQIVEKQNLNYEFGTIGSGDVWNNEKDRVEWFSKKYQMICEDMETIGVYQIGERFEIPTIGIRIISNNLLLEEKYDKSVTKKGQGFVYTYIKEWINRKGKLCK